MNTDTSLSRQQALSMLQSFSQEFCEEAVSRVLKAVYLFDFLDRVVDEEFTEDWLDALQVECMRIDELAETAQQLFLGQNDHIEGWGERELLELAAKTGEVYFQLWKDFSDQEYYEEASHLLAQRLLKNKASVDGFRNGLDAGCGSGRYTQALKALGVSQVTGLDYSANSVEFAQSKNAFPKEVRFEQGNVLELPFGDEQFDFVLSNGVLHHTASTQEGLQEIYRVLQPGGKMLLYLYGGKDSFFWDVVDTCRALLKDIPQAYTQMVMRVLGYRPGRIFHRNDFFYVPVHRRYFSCEVDAMLEDAGFSHYERWLRGVPHDLNEVVATNKHLDPYIHGEGDLRYWVTK